MKTKIGIFGSCLTRDVFRSVHNDYKKDYNLVFDQLRSSIVSVMQEPVEYDKETIYVSDGDVHSRVNAQFIENDLKKTFIKEMKKGVDYLIIDVFFDVYFGILSYDDNIITNNEWSLQETEFYKNIPNKKIIKMEHNREEFMKIWTKNCDLFFNYVNAKYPRVKIILNKVQVVDTILKNDGTYVKDPIYEAMVKKYNPLFDELERYIEKNHRVYVVDFPENITADENNIWGSGAMHFNKNYYSFVYLEIKNIVLKNEVRRLKFKVNTILNSTSWKSTAPLRDIKYILTRKY